MTAKNYDPQEVIVTFDGKEITGFGQGILQTGPGPDTPSRPPRTSSGEVNIVGEVTGRPISEVDHTPAIARPCKGCSTMLLPSQSRCPNCGETVVGVLSRMPSETDGELAERHKSKLESENGKTKQAKVKTREAAQELSESIVGAIHVVSIKGKVST